MTSDQIINVVLQIAPSVIAILTMVGSIFRIWRDFREVKNQVADMKCIDHLKDQISLVIRENYELKKKINETLTKIDHIERK